MIPLDCTGRSQTGLKWLTRLFNTGDITSPRGSNPFASIRLDYNTQQRYHSFRFFVPPEARARLPIPGGYENGGPWLYTFMSKAGVDQKCFVVDRLEGHRSKCNSSYTFLTVVEPPVSRDSVRWVGRPTTPRRLHRNKRLPGCTGSRRANTIMAYRDDRYSCGIQGVGY